ncbi:MAG: TonB-dependent receptor, partial [Sphingobacteriaceae bacterium]
SAISGVLNVELINEEGNIAQSIKIPLASGLGAGDFALADTLKEGNYRIRAYTNWMRNAGEDYFFEKNIAIVNAISNKVFTKTSYTYSTQNGAQKVNAVITYTDINGQPYAAKEVSYQVQADAHNITKGKGVTDDKGNLAITFTNNVSGLFSSGRLVTVISIEEKEKITKTVLIKALSGKVDVQFFPEGGYLVNGIGSKVAFKATGADGLGKDIKGIVKDEQGNTVTAFSSQHLGMGVFTLVPQMGKTYKATISYPDGSENVIDMPVAKTSGYVLRIDNSNTTAVILRLSITDTVTNSSPVTIVAQSGGKLLFAAKSKAGKSGFVTSVPKSRFPSGIVQFTIFSSTGEPITERLIFIQNPDQLKLDIVAAKQSYLPRERVKLDINAKTDRDSVVEGSFSISVIDETKVKVDEEDENSILANILLTSELKGYIEKPNYYFINPNDKTRADLDVLMLTQGYRRFEWKQIMSDNFLPAIYQPERSLEASGTITQKGKPVAGAKVTLFSTTGGIFSADTVADAQGRFKFNNLLFADSARLVVQATTPAGKKNVDVTLDSNTPQLVTKNKNIPGMRVSINDGLVDYLKYNNYVNSEYSRYGVSKKTVVLNEVVIAEKKVILKNSANLNGPGNANYVLLRKDLSMACTTLDMCLQGRLPSVLIDFKGRAYSARGDGRFMLIVVDGGYMPVDYLRTININDVESVELLKDASKVAVYGPEGSGGVLVITTRRGEPNYDYLKRPSPGVISYAPQGYYVARAFYSPKYGDPKTNEALADLRTTVYWSPNIITDKQGKASATYFNAGSKGTYRVVIEGIDNSGRIGRQVYHYRVE